MFFLYFSRIIPRITKRTIDPDSAKGSRAGTPAPHKPAPHKLVPQKTDLRLGRIVRLLMDNATVVVSGTKIADEIGTNRSEVWRLARLVVPS